jgi:ribose-phosphate pyrophosphokinase
LLVVSLPGNERLGREIAAKVGGDFAAPAIRRFPDEETYLRLDTPCEERDVVLVATLDRPDSKFLSLCFLSDLAHELRARRCLLVAPYLAYMRQDTRFRTGEAVTSRSFARLLSDSVDAVVTVDPHLHRYASLGELYTVPTRVVHAAPPVADWIRNEIADPLLVGPDSESEQWVADVAERAGAPFIVLEKTRRGDRDVEISVPEVERWRMRQAVLVDDIISTARTMTETAGHLIRAGLAAPVCVGVHAVFAGDACTTLRAAGVDRIVTTDTIHHETNTIGVGGALAAALEELLD